VPGASGAAGRCGRAGQRLIHDLADRAGTAAALRAATETAIHLPGRARPLAVFANGGPHIVVAQDIAGTDDHRGKLHKVVWRAFEIDQLGMLAKHKIYF